MIKNYLAAMGIESWKLSRSLPGAKVSHDFQLCQLTTHDEQNAGYLLLDNLMIDDYLEEKITRLLASILAAIGLKVSERLQNTPTFLGNEKIIIMGKYEAQLPSHVTTVVTLHPVTLLQQPLLKKQVWRDLQVLL